MGIDSIEAILGNNTFYTKEYLNQSITLIKSIVLKTSAEASSYNEHIRAKYPGAAVGEDPLQWRYYKQLSGALHDLDVPVMVTSVDNGTTIDLTRSTMAIHKKTKAELLKFEQFYEQTVARYPEQELYIKAVICQPAQTDIQTLVDLPDFTIVYHNPELIEENEHDLILTLQARINNYKSIWLIQHYAVGYSLFLASQYHILYNFLLTSLLSIRLQNCKTVRTHSYHIRLYLASHHKLDEHLLFLTKKQQLYLYRNMLYLDNHAGHNQTFRSLIDVLFTDRNISVVNYVYTQQNQLTQDYHPDYTYERRLLNSKKMVHATTPVSLLDLQEKERLLAPGNAKEYDYRYADIDRTNKRSLFSQLLTKDLETILVDETDSVKYKLINTIVDYWAYLLKTERVAFLVDVTDPVTNVTKRVNTKDLFKLFVVGLHQQQGIQLSTFPDYQIQRVLNPEVPTEDELLQFFYEPRIEYRGYLTEIRQNIPLYGNLITSYQFAEFVTGIYRLNIGLWHMLSNMSDVVTHPQMEMAVSNLHISKVYSFGDETVDEFFRRTGLRDIRTYDRETATGYVFSILDNVFDKKLSYLNRLKKLQHALGEVFFKFNSYTVQLINNYFSDSPLLVGARESRYGLTYISKHDLSNTTSVVPSIHIDATGKTKVSETLLLEMDVDVGVKERSEVSMDSLIQLDVQVTDYTNADVTFQGASVLSIDEEVTGYSEHEILFNGGVTDHSEKLRSDVGVGFSTPITHSVVYSVQESRVIDLSSGFSIESQSSDGQELSDDHLAFLAMNL